MIGYLRDFASRYNFVAESFETSVPWKDVQKLCLNVEKRIISDCQKHGVKKAPFISFRCTQVIIQ
jgi:alkyldihydroxyacetonephosphate synthase